MKFIFRLILIVLIVAVLAVVMRNMILKIAIEQGSEIATGMRVQVNSIGVGIRTTNIEIRDLKIYNPKSYEEPLMLDMPRISIDYNLKDILNGLIHLEAVVIHLNQFNVVKNSKGNLNLNELPVVKDTEKQASTKPEPTKKGPAPKMQIDYFDLQFGSLAFIDYSKDAINPNVNTFALNLNERHTNITNPTVIGLIIIQKALFKASLAQLSGFDLGGIQNVISSRAGDLGALAGDSLGAAKDASAAVLSQASNMAKSAEELQKLGAATSDAGEKAADTLKESAESLKDLASKVKLPFSKSE